MFFFFLAVIPTVIIFISIMLTTMFLSTNSITSTVFFQCVNYNAVKVSTFGQKCLPNPNQTTTTLSMNPCPTAWGCKATIAEGSTITYILFTTDSYSTTNQCYNTKHAISNPLNE